MDSHILCCTAGFGIAADHLHHAVNSMIRFADKAMYEAKNPGINKVVLLDSSIYKFENANVKFNC
ncbi:MAG: hypothetical protein OEV78_11380 [Spirochaetia bacterium]|nr:hypothetical protein [Spirochaetia bacterium]